MLLTGPVRPRDVDGNLLLKRDFGDFCRNPPDCRGGNAGSVCRCIWRIGRIEVAARQQLEHRPGASSINHVVRTGQGGGSAWGICIDQTVLCAVPHQRAAVSVPDEQAVLSFARRLTNKPSGIRVADQEVQIDPSRAQQLVHQGEDEQAVGARPDPEPFVGNGRIAGSNRIDREELTLTTRLESP